MKHCKNKSNLDIVKSYLSNERPFTQVGWTSDSIKRKEGEIWEDSKGHKWIYKNGNKKRINNISQNVGIEEKCKCGQDIKFGNKMDRKFYNKTGMCYDCLIKYETELRRTGKYENYEKRKIFSNQKSVCLELKVKLEESIKFLENENSKLTYQNEDGTTETWTQTNRLKLLGDAKKDYKELLEALDRIENQLKSLEDK